MAHRKVTAFRCSACLLLVAWQFLAQAQDSAKNSDTKKEAVDAKTISALIGQLGDADFDVRDGAAKKLKAIGEPALDLLEKAARESKDPELRNNAEVLVRELTKGMFTEVRQFNGHQAAGKQPWVTRVVITPDGRRAVSVGADAVRAWDLASGKEVVSFGDRKGTACWGLAMSADGARVIIGCNGSQAHIFDLASGKKISSLIGHTLIVWGVALSADGKQAVTGSGDRTIRVWDADSGKQLRAFDEAPDEIRCLDRSRDGKLVVTGHFAADNEPGIVRLWDFATGKEIRAIEGHKEAVTSIYFSPDSKTILSASWDKTARLWDVANGKELKSLEGHINRVEHAAFASKGTRVVTCGNLFSPEVRVWDVANGRQIYEGEKIREGFFGIAGAPDGRFCVSGGRDGVVRLWEWKR